MVAIWIGLVVLGAVVVLLMPVLLGWDVYASFRREREVVCPETQAPVQVQVNTRYAVSTALNGRMRLRLSSCTRWPTRADCGQECVAQIPLERPRGAVAAAAGVNHAAVSTAAFLGWLLAMVWYAEPVFGTAYMRVLGISQEMARVRAERILPYLAVLAANVLVAYVLAGVLKRKHWQGAPAGMAAGSLAWLVFLVVSLATTLLGRQPWVALWINAGYVLVACLLIGSVIGGWDRLTREAQEPGGRAL